MGIIYMAKSISSGKVYIGKTIHSLEKRKNQHLNTAKKGGGYRFHSAIRKYGNIDFEWTILDRDIPNHQLFDLESKRIEEYSATVPAFGYNVEYGSGHWDGTVLGALALKRLCKDYKDLCALNAWAKRRLPLAEPGRKLEIKGNKLTKILLPVFIQCIPVSYKTTCEMMEKLERVFDIIDDRTAKYKIRGYWDIVEKVGA